MAGIVTDENWLKKFKTLRSRDEAARQQEAQEREDDMTAQPKQVTLELVGINGNAFAVLGAFIKAAREQGWTQDEIDPVWQEATSGDYNHLLQTVMQHTK